VCVNITYTVQSITSSIANTRHSYQYTIISFADNFQCEIWGSHSEADKYPSLLTHDVVSIRFGRLHVQGVSRLGRVDLESLDSEGRGSNLVRNVYHYLSIGTVSHHTRHVSSTFSEFSYVTVLGIDRVTEVIAHKVFGYEYEHYVPTHIIILYY
jgi:hypothetical protein